ncbi:hypothetical protein LZ31DRAFT_235847 [Colletotrichum somersetense]|nr:hypothetical protein LZ31DRAFT_235847 [Colletotrichum somersetense]
MNACCCPSHPIHYFDSHCCKRLASKQFLLSQTPNSRPKKKGMLPWSIPSLAFGSPDPPTPRFAFISSTGVCALVTSSIINTISESNWVCA